MHQNRTVSFRAAATIALPCPRRARIRSRNARSGPGCLTTLHAASTSAHRADADPRLEIGPASSDLRSDAVPSPPDRDPNLAPAAIRIRVAVGLGPDAGHEPMIARTPRAKNLALLLLAMTQFVIVIDASIVNVALPSIGAHLHFFRDDLT